MCADLTLNGSDGPSKDRYDPYHMTERPWLQLVQSWKHLRFCFRAHSNVEDLLSLSLSRSLSFSLVLSRFIAFSLVFSRFLSFSSVFPKGRQVLYLTATRRLACSRVSVFEDRCCFPAVASFLHLCKLPFRFGRL